MSEITIDNNGICGLQQELHSARTIKELRDISSLMPSRVRLLLGSGIDIHRAVQMISGFNDAVTLRLITLLEDTEGLRLPPGAALLVLGSEGRGEQTLRTDQDNAIAYADTMPPSDLHTLESFAVRLVDGLAEIGVPRCPGNIMVSNPEWRHSISEWRQLLEQWIGIPTPANVLHFGTFQDLRTLYGARSAESQLSDYICTTVAQNHLFFPNMAHHVVRFPSPFTIFGNLRVESGGPHNGLLDLKKAGIFAITTGTSLLALEHGVIGGDTWKKLDLLGAEGFLSSGDLDSIRTAFNGLVLLRLQQQLRDLDAGVTPGNHIDPHRLDSDDQARLREALKGVNTFLWIFRNHYLLDYISM